MTDADSARISNATAQAEPPRIVIGEGRGPTLFDSTSELICVKQQPLPGIVIFVHGVNSEGEWFEAAEEGLCKGLNRRLARLDDQMAYRGVAGGQLTPAQYTESLTPDGFLNPKLWAGTYIKPSPSFSPVIHFRWGYKANKEELKEYGDKIFLNEQDYWGGGPFANGTSSLPDLWHEGLDDRIFGFISVQAVNPTQRPLFRTPPRGYCVLAALRLAKLVESIRRKQASVPITIVCHSQGNMVGLAAAFFGDALPPVTDPWNNTGRCVADAYVLANPPYSLANAGAGMENWSQRKARDVNNRGGRETYTARTKTFGAFLEIIRDRAALEVPADQIDREMGNTRTSESGGKPYAAGDDRTAHGLNGNTYGRVTLYCCPHDQVISAVTVQGIGWRGLGYAGDQPSQELLDVGAQGVLTQRVFASGIKVGECREYRFWEDDWRYEKGSTPGFWYPPSPPAKYGLTRAWSGNEDALARVLTTAAAPVLYVVTLATSAFKLFRVNADPPKGWTVRVDAPPLDEPFEPEALRYGHRTHVSDGPHATSVFNEGNDPPAAARDAEKQDKKADDPYDNYTAEEEGQQAIGNVDSEASQRYEDHAILRMRARRVGNSSWVDSNGNVIGEDGKSAAPQGYEQWRNKQVTQILDAGRTNNPTNHSTILTNPMHAEKALAYDVAIGLCYLTPKQLSQLRIEADWRLGEGLKDENPNKKYTIYFATGKMNGEFLSDWIALKDSEARRPEKIADEREGEFFLKVGGIV
jgi:pimeloyl-ACP methyl ester carboxylesterase